MTKSKLEPLVVTDWKSYAAGAARTASRRSERLEYLIPGLVAEVNELEEAVTHADNYVDEHIIKEMGDCLWFLAELMRLLELDQTTNPDSLLAQLDNREPESVWSCVQSARQSAAAICDIWAKAVRDNQGGVLDPLGVQKLEVLLLDILQNLRQAFQAWGTSFTVVAQANIDKLTDRYNRNVISGSGDNR